MNTPTNAAMRPSFSEEHGKLVRAFASRFTSGNSVPVERTHITRAEWDAICAFVQEQNAIIGSWKAREEERSESGQRETLDAAQPAQAGEAVAWREIRPDGTPVSSEGCYYSSPPPTGRILDYIYEKGGRVEYVYAHPQPEQPASAVDDLGPTVDPATWPKAMAAIEAAPSLDESQFVHFDAEQSPAVSPPSVVAVSEEDVEAACVAACSGEGRTPWASDDWDRDREEFRAWVGSALESFAQRIAGSGERDAWLPIESAPKDGREVLLRVAMRAGIPGRCLVGHYMAGGHCIEDHPPIDAGWYFWNGLMFDQAAQPIEWSPIPRAAIAQRSDKRGGA